MNKLQLVFIIGVIFFTRFLFIEADPPAYNQSGINITDEPYYCLSGLELYNKSQDRFIDVLSFQNADFIKWHNKYLTFLSLNMFGNNYFGLRLPVIALSILSLGMLVAVAYKFLRNKWLWFLFALVLVLDVQFLYASKFQNPQPYSIFYLSLAFYCLQYISHNVKYVVVSLIIVFNIFLVYPYVAFLGVGYGVWIIYSGLRRRDFNSLGYAIFGTALGLILVLWVVYLHDMTPFDYLDFFIGVSEIRDESELSNGFKSLLIRGFDIPNTLLFSYNPILFLSFAGIIILLMGRRYETLPELVQLSIFIMLAAILQSFLISSYPFKKWLILLPTSFVIASYFIDSFQIIKLTRLERIIAQFVALILLILIVRAIGLNFNAKYWASFAKYYEIDTSNTVLRNALSIVSLLVFLFVIVSLKSKLFWGFSNHVVALVLIPLVWIQVMYFINIKFEGRDVLSQSKPELHGKIILGGFSHAFTFYNDAIPTYNPYIIQKLHLNKDLFVGSILSSNRGDVYYFEKDLLNNNDKHTKIINSFSLTKLSDGCFDLYRYE